MNKYQVTILISELDDYFWQVLPDHRERINDLLTKEVIETYGVNTARTKGWITINAGDEDEVVNILESFPISEYITYEIDQLFIFDNALGLMPRMVLN